MENSPSVRLKFDLRECFIWDAASNIDIISTYPYSQPTIRKIPPGHHISRNTQSIARSFNIDLPLDILLTNPSCWSTAIQLALNMGPLRD